MSNANLSELMTNNKKTFDRLFKNTYPKLFFYARGIVGDDYDAEDVVEEVFCELWQRMDDIEIGAHIEGFLYRAVYTRAINLLKRRGASAARTALLDEINTRRMETLASDAGDPHGMLENEDLRKTLEAAIGALPAKCAQVFRMSYIEGMKNDEIARSFGISVRTVEAHMYHALRCLRENLGKLTFLTLFLSPNL